MANYNKNPVDHTPNNMDYIVNLQLQLAQGFEVQPPSMRSTTHIKMFTGKKETQLDLVFLLF